MLACTYALRGHRLWTRLLAAMQFVLPSIAVLWGPIFVMASVVSLILFPPIGALVTEIGALFFQSGTEDRGVVAWPLGLRVRMGRLAREIAQIGRALV